MKQPLKQVNFYRRALAAGCAQGFEPDGQLCLHLTGAQGGAYFVSFDTADPTARTTALSWTAISPAQSSRSSPP